MYSTCLFCHASLGTNEAIESFPIGRRLAFDAAQGRLWVICRKCERWNLTPMEERWEAVEQCERLFVSTRLRVSSDNIGMSRLRDGLELVRIGKPQRPEMAAWRYGDQFGRRRRNYLLLTGGVGVVVAGLVIAGPGTGLIAGGGWGTFQLLNALQKAARDRIVRTRVAVPGMTHPSVLRGKDMKRIVIATSGDEWTMRLPYNKGALLSSDAYPKEVTLTGENALRAASSILPLVNLKGAKKDEVGSAVGLLEATPDAHQLFRNAAADGIGKGRSGGRADRYLTARSKGGGEVFLDRLPRTVALALEMASHEDIERRAMEGELGILEQAWRQAEEIAAISDSLLLPENVDQQFEAIKKNAG